MSQNTFSSRQSIGDKGYGRRRYAEVPDNPSPHFWWDECGFWSITTPVGRDITNQIRNPSFELNTDGWVPGGVSTIAQNFLANAFGRQGASVSQPTFLGSAAVRYQGAPFPAITINQGETAFFTVWVRAPIGTEIEVDLEHLNPIPGQQFALGRNRGIVNGTGDWIQVATSLTFTAAYSPPATTLDIVPRIVVSQSGTPAPFSFDFDGAMLTVDVQIDSYFDGSTGGGTWDGPIHASTSTLSRFVRGYGTINNFTDLGLDIIGDSGWGIPPVEGITSSYATTIGRHFQRQRFLPRTATIIGIIQGCCLTDVYQKRRVIQRRFLYNFAEYCNEGLTLNYQLRSPCCQELTRRLELRGMQYAGGMEGDRDNLHFERVALQFTSTNDPFWTNPIENYVDTDPLFGATVRINHNSTAPVFPIIQFQYTGLNNANQPLDGGGLINDTINQSIQFRDGTSIDFVPDEIILLDTDPQNFRFISSTGTDYSHLIDYEASTLGLPMIVPGENFIRADFDGPVIGSFDITWRYHEKFLSVDDYPLLRTCCSCGKGF